VTGTENNETGSTSAALVVTFDVEPEVRNALEHELQFLARLIGTAFERREGVENLVATACIHEVAEAVKAALHPTSSASPSASRPSVPSGDE
jgi:hypothetical protein